MIGGVAALAAMSITQTVVQLRAPRGQRVCTALVAAWVAATARRQQDDGDT